MAFNLGASSRVRSGALPDGTVTGQILYWDNVLKVWTLLNEVDGQFLKGLSGKPAYVPFSSGQVVLGGASATLTSSTYAAIPTYPLTLALPSAGTYFIFANVRGVGSYPNYTSVELYDFTNTAAIPNSERSVGYSQSGVGFFYPTAPLNWLITTAGAISLRLYAKVYSGTSIIYNDSDGRTVFGYIQIA